jgi:hypothetical protein
MDAWTSDELEAIGTSEELRIASLQADGSLSRSTIIWVVRLGDDLYVRSYLGRGSNWFRRVQARHEGHIQAGGIDKDVTLVEVADASINDELDAQYRAKYSHHSQSVVESVMTPDARSASIKLVPRRSAA